MIPTFNKMKTTPAMASFEPTLPRHSDGTKKRAGKNFSAFCFQPLGCISAILIFIITMSCDISKNKTDPASGFSKVYDNDSIEVSYTAIDVKEMPGGGYILLAATNAGHTYLLRVDSKGKLLWEKYYSQYINPISELIQFGDNIYFFSLSSLFSEGTFLLRINDAAAGAEVLKNYADKLRPLCAAGTPDGGFLIQEYDQENEKTVLLKLNASGDPDVNFDQDGYKEYDIQVTEAIDEMISNHISRQGPQLPLLVGHIGGEVSNYYYFNGFYKTDLSLIIVNTTTGTPMKRISGYRYQKCITNLTDLGNNKIGFSRFEYENNFLVPNLALDSVPYLSSNSTFGGLDYNQLVARTIVKSRKINLRGRSLGIFAASTKGNTVGLFAYDAVTGVFAGAKYFGNTFPYTMGNFTATADGGMAVLCQTYVSGRYARMALFKLSKEEAESFIK